MPPSTFAKAYMNNVVAAAPMTIPIVKITSPASITGKRPLTSDIAPENSWTTANGNMNAGMAISIAVGSTANSKERGANRTRTTLPVIGPNAKRRNITTSRDLVDLELDKESCDVCRVKEHYQVNFLSHLFHSSFFTLMIFAK